MLEIIFYLIVLLFSVVLHEISHGLVAESLGDPTPRVAGRISINPLKHLDPIGSFLLPLMIFILTLGQGPILGYAKPVPINPFFFRGDKKRGILKVSLAGPASNFILAFLFALLIRFFPHLPPRIIFLFSVISHYNFLLAFFNMLPVPPLDGFHVFSYFLEEKFPAIRFFLIQNSFLIFLFVLFFGLNFVYNISHFFFRLFSNL